MRRWYWDKPNNWMQVGYAEDGKAVTLCVFVDITSNFTRWRVERENHDTKEADELNLEFETPADVARVQRRIDEEWPPAATTTFGWQKSTQHADDVHLVRTHGAATEVVGAVCAMPKEARLHGQTALWNWWYDAAGPCVNPVTLRFAATRTEALDALKKAAEADGCVVPAWEGA